MEVKFQGLDELIAEMRDVAPKQIRYATMVAMTRTASMVRDRIYSEMHKVFDHPTQYTLRAIRVKPATKTDMTAEVGFKEAWAVRSTKYLEPQVESGGRKVKAFEKAIQQRVLLQPWGKRYPAGTQFVPGRGARLDSSGNISSGQLNQIMSALKAQSDTKANETQRSRERAKRKESYWATPRGIWHIQGKSMQMALVVAKQSPKYARRLRFYELSNQFANQIIQDQFAIALEEALATAKQ